MRVCEREKERKVRMQWINKCPSHTATKATMKKKKQLTTDSIIEFNKKTKE